MEFQYINDHSQMQPGDLLEFRCPRFGLVTQWRVWGIHLGAMNQESLIEVQSITNRPADDFRRMMVPEQMTRPMTLIRPA